MLAQFYYILLLSNSISLVPDNSDVYWAGQSFAIWSSCWPCCKAETVSWWCPKVHYLIETIPLLWIYVFIFLLFFHDFPDTIIFILPMVCRFMSCQFPYQKEGSCQLVKMMTYVAFAQMVEISFFVIFVRGLSIQVQLFVFLW